MNTHRLGKLLPPRTVAFSFGPRSAEGLTRFELVAVLGVMALLLAVVLPALASNRERSEKLVCFANLRSVSQALQQWGTEHDNRVPWRTPWCEGGTMPVSSPTCSGPQPSWVSAGLYNNSWLQFFWISNEFRTPTVLACPSDPQKHPANNWGNGPDGFLHPVYRNAGVSYFIGLDVFAEDKNALTSGDRNVRFIYDSSLSCSSLVRPNAAISYTPFPPGSGIDDQIHVRAGNFLFSDGSVEELTSAGFFPRLFVPSEIQDNSTAHYLTPTN